METRTLFLTALAIFAGVSQVEAQKCTYKFTVPGKDGCSSSDSNLSDLQSQVTSLLEQNTALLKENAQWRNDIKYHVDILNNLTKQVKHGSANAVYTRWGASVCPDTAQLLYTGYAGGSYYYHYGGTTDILCLPKEPEWNLYKDGFQAASYVYGAEYQIPKAYDTGMVFRRAYSGSTTLNDHNVPCSVCLTPGRSVTHTFPAKRTCPDGWQKEYEGYLMAEHYGSRGRVKSICVDEAPEAIEGSGKNDASMTLYNMEAYCGALPCPKYVHGRELTCVTCSL